MKRRIRRLRTVRDLSRFDPVWGDGLGHSRVDPVWAVKTQFLGTRVLKLLIHLGPSNGSRTTCWFKFGKNGVDAENAGIYGSQSRDDFDRDDVEQYFNYMGMLAVEGTYDKMEALLDENIHPVDILLLLAASEGDKPKIEELLRAGAD